MYEGGSRSQAASLGGVGLQIVRDCRASPEGLKAGKAKGREPLLNDQQRKALAAAVEKGLIPYLDGVVRCRLVDLRSGFGRNTASQSAAKRSDSS